MGIHIAFLRAVNVGGTGKLAMVDLRALCAAEGFQGARTLIQSGNLVFCAEQDSKAVRATLEAALLGHLGAPVDVIMRSPAELAVILDHNPFRQANPARVAVVLARVPIERAVVSGIEIPGQEQLANGIRELYIHYPDGMGASKLTLPKTLGPVTARNLNTVRRTLELAESLS